MADSPNRENSTTRWTPQALEEALKRAHSGDRTVAMQESGVMTTEGKLSERYKSWGTAISVTEDDKAEQ